MQKQHHVYYIHIIWDKFRPLKKKKLFDLVFFALCLVFFSSLRQHGPMGQESNDRNYTLPKTNSSHLTAPKGANSSS